MKKRNCAALLIAILLGSPGVLPGAAQAPENPVRSPVRLVMRERPSLEIGKALVVDFTAKAHLDLQRLSPSFETSGGTLDFNRLRVGVEGEFLDHFEFEVERELRETVGGREYEHPWRDAYLNIDYFDALQFKVGKFKIPFSVEQLTGVSNLNFISRSRLADHLAPARDVGALLHGRLFDRLEYEAGIFRNDGENSASNADVRGQHALVFRLTGTPFQLFPLSGDWDEAEFGAAVVTSDVTEGLSGLRGRTVAGEEFFPRVHVKGRRLRIGGDARWRPGPFSLQAELVRVHERREGQSVRQEDLPPRITTAWYVATTWALTGESKENGIEPRRAFPSEGAGAIELALRYEEIFFGSGNASGTPFRSSRAPNLMANSDRVWTFGMNWYLNRYAKIQLNGVRERITDPERSPVEGQPRLWMALMRLQFSM
jgi:phosphate-selective porin OprO/OprP